MRDSAARASTVWQALMQPPWRLLFGTWPWRALAYLLVSAALGAVLLPLGIATLLILPLWGIAIGALERRRTRFLGFPRQTSGHVPLSREQRPIWLSVRLSEAATWRETAALLVDLVLGWAAIVALFFEGLALVVMVALGVIGSTRESEVLLFRGLRVVIGPDNWWLVIPLGLIVLGLISYANAILAGAQASLLRMLCGPRQQELSRNVERLIQSRATLVEAFEAERRRIERDLHDGVQQELVTLATRLGMASLELDELATQGTDTASARRALDAAQDQAEHAMATLRDTVRGIHPAVLTDHGLRAALEELADRTPIPLVLDLVEHEAVGHEGAEHSRLPAPLETAAYYLVTEAISNAAKHSSARRLHVRAVVSNDSLAVTVTDDGQGGADERAGTGLRGLRERAETLGGSFTLLSPTGGPTSLHMTLPIATGPSTTFAASSARAPSSTAPPVSTTSTHERTARDATAAR